MSSFYFTNNKGSRTLSISIGFLSRTWKVIVSFRLVLKESQSVLLLTSNQTRFFDDEIRTMSILSLCKRFLNLYLDCASLLVFHNMILSE